jgi:hypothetical protein
VITLLSIQLGSRIDSGDGVGYRVMSPSRVVPYGYVGVYKLYKLSKLGCWESIGRVSIIETLYNLVYSCYRPPHTHSEPV